MFFFDKNQKFADHALFVDDHCHSVTYSDWFVYANTLKKRIPARSLVFILCRNTIGSALSYLCCLQNRIVPLLINAAVDPDLLNNLVKLYTPAYLFKPLNNNGQPPNDNQLLYTIEDYGLYRCPIQKNVELFPKLALLLTTSGSTGSPKLVRQSYENIQSNASSIASYLELTDQERPISSLPMYYTFGLSVINSHLICGATVYLTESTIFDTTFWRFCQDRKISSIAGVPFTYECLKKLSFFNMNLPNLTLILQAGGKLAKPLHKDYAEFAAKTNKKFIAMYGQTEATARMSYLPVAYSLAKIGSIGIAIPGGKFHIMENKNTEITEPFVAGELCYDGPNVTLGYAHCAADLKHGNERHGRLWTGDIAYKDADGFYYITGRQKRFVKIQGKRINMDEVEQLFKNAYTTYDFACAGEDDDLRIFTTAPAIELESLSSFLTEKIHLHPSLFKLLAIDAIPKNSSGKTQYKVLPS
jgi:long-chain acyl-CoA synthetase